MYSGQEIVSQEECKIQLAEFYEGVDCYNATDNKVKFTLSDMSVMEYNIVTLTMTTRNFSCRPVILPEHIGVTFEASLPEGTTGLEVIMHTGGYQRIRTMPLKYLKNCNRVIIPDDCRYGCGGPGDTRGFSYLSKFCIEGDKTRLEIIGEIDKKGSRYLILVGAIGSNNASSEALKIELLDASLEPMLIRGSYSYVTVKEPRYTYNPATGEYEEELVDVKKLIVLATKAKYVRIGGLKGGVYQLANCSNKFEFDEIVSFCNMTLPEPGYTQVILASLDTPTFVNGRIKAGSSSFKILPEMKLLNDLTDNPLMFKTGSRIDIQGGSTSGIFEIEKCNNWDIPIWHPDVFIITFHMYIPEGSSEWVMDLEVYGSFIYDDDSITNTSSGAGNMQVYTWFNYKDEMLDIQAGHVVFDQKNFKLSATAIPVNWCAGYYNITGVYKDDIPGSISTPPNTDPRLKWDKDLCKEVLNCESAGLYLPVCAACLDTGEDQITISYTADPGYVCTCSGPKLRHEITPACEPKPEGQPNNFPLGVYPYVEELGTSSGIKRSRIHFKGTKMYLYLEVPTKLSFFVYLGDLQEGIHSRSVIDGADGSEHIVSFYAFFFLAILKLPYKYLTVFGLDPVYWYDIQHDREQDSGIIEEGILGMDFSVEASRLSLPSAWQQFDWQGKCFWAQSIIHREELGNLVVGKSSLDLLDELDCEVKETFEHFTTNIELLMGLPEDPARLGSLQEDYDLFARTVSLLVSRNAEAYAYELGMYQENYRP